MKGTILGKIVLFEGDILQNKLQISKFAVVFTALRSKRVSVLDQNMAQFELLTSGITLFSF